MMKKVFLLNIRMIGYIFVFTIVSYGNTCNLPFPPYKWTCSSSPCDNILKDVMGKQRDTLEARLDDLIDTIKANTKQTKYQTKIIKREVIVYKALLKRIEKESLSLKEASYLSKKIKDSEALGGTIDITRKGK